MGKSLVLAEKPSVGRDIARVLGCQKKSNSHFESNKYIVTWAMGHLVSLAAPEKYKKDWADWKMETLPMLPKPFKLEFLKPTSKQYFGVKKLLERGDVSEVIIATDAGREGELVARWILDFSHCKKPIKRLWISSVTDKAIREGFNKLVDGRKYNDLYYAARARAKADWIVGINGTRALTCKFNAGLSMGRVQTPTLGLVAKRDDEIRQFKPKTYTEITAALSDAGDYSGMNLKWFSVKGNNKITRLESRDKAEEIRKTLASLGVVKSVETKVKKVYSKGLYDLTELQRDANKAYGFSAKETLNIMQGLYEKHKVLTYPRTDSKFLTEDIVETIPERVRACRKSGDKEDVSFILRSKIKGNKSFVNDAKVGDHHAIIPTEQAPIYTDFSNKEQKIYKMVVKRFLSVLLPPKEVETISLVIKCKNETFSGKTEREISGSWASGKSGSNHISGSDSSKTNNLKTNTGKSNSLKSGDKVRLNNIKLNQVKTEPPKHLTEGDLLHEMEKSGLGTVATRSDIIEKIINNSYVDLSDNRLRTTRTGRQLLDLVPYKIKTSDLTSKWEKDLEKISKGQLKEEQFMSEMVGFTKEIVSEIKKSDHTFKHDNLSTENCPECGKKLLIQKGKHGKRLICQDRNCGYRKNLSKTTNARCPQCHKKLELVGEGDNKTFICKCGYKEKLTAFNKRKQAKSSSMSKREVQKYMNKSKKQEENFNNPFADLLGDLKK